MLFLFINPVTLTTKRTNRPISILTSLSPVFEKLLYQQINRFVRGKSSTFLYSFRKNHSTQHALLKLVQEWQTCLDNQGKIGTILMDLSKAFDSLSHELLIGKLAAYGFDLSSLKLMSNYLGGRLQRVKTDSTSNKWLEMLLGIPQGSIL